MMMRGGAPSLVDAGGQRAYVIKNVFPADQIGNGRSDYEI
jgi:hypothetical protein